MEAGRFRTTSGPTIHAFRLAEVPAIDDITIVPAPRDPRRDRLVCPCCGGPVARLRTRFIDRLLGRLRGIKRRYRCTIVTCGWTTVAPVEPDPALLRAWDENNRRDLRG